MENKKRWWILIVVLIALIIIVIVTFLFISKKECSNANPLFCKMSCQTDNDCKFQNCVCVSSNENVVADISKKGVCASSGCKCIENRCTGIKEGCTTIKPVKTSGGGELTFEAHYALSCIYNTKEECENTTDIVGYNTAKGTFGEPDGLPDCKWVVEYPESIFI